MPAGGRRLVRGSVVRRPPGRGDGEASQGEASGGQESNEGGQEEDGDPHLPTPGGLPAGPGSGPCPQHHGHNVEGADTAQLPYSRRNWMRSVFGAMLPRIPRGVTLIRAGRDFAEGALVGTPARCI